MRRLGEANCQCIAALARGIDQPILLADLGHFWGPEIADAVAVCCPAGRLAFGKDEPFVSPRFEVVRAQDWKGVVGVVGGRDEDIALFGLEYRRIAIASGRARTQI